MGRFLDRLWKLRWLFGALAAISLALPTVLMVRRHFRGEETDMGAGTLAMACLWLVGQVPGDVVYTNQLKHSIGVQYKGPRTDIKEVRLFCSPNQGRDWDLASVITPDKDFFVFRAPGDGTYWLCVAPVNHKGEQFPDNPRTVPPNQKMVIDTVKPVIRVLQARRQGGEVVVAWQVQEDNPDVPSFRLEYQPKDGAGLWTAIHVPPAGSGETRFQPNGNVPLQIRLSLRDLAGNKSEQVVEVAGDNVTTAAFNPLNHSGGVVQTAGTSPSGAAVEINQELKVPSPLGAPAQPTVPGPVEPLPAPAHAGVGIASPSVAPTPIPAAPRDEEARVIASSSWTPAAPPSPPQPAGPVAPPPGPEVKPVAPPSPERKLPPLQYINQPEFLVEYEVSKHGPSGIGSVELYRTRDDGMTWENYARDITIRGLARNKHIQRTLRFKPGDPDGIYGFTLVIKNGANIGRLPPQPGEVPEIRVKLDTKLPAADLLAPTRDTEPGCLLLSWRAADENIAPNPVNLEWAPQRGGPWNAIAVNLPNSGRYSWKLPDEMPVNVYLRLRVRDLAGNETSAVTPNPLPVDLLEPEGHILRVSVPVRPQ